MRPVYLCYFLSVGYGLFNMNRQDRICSRIPVSPSHFRNVGNPMEYADF